MTLLENIRPSNIWQSLHLKTKKKKIWVPILCHLQDTLLRGKRNKAPDGCGWILISAKKQLLSPKRWLKVWPTRSASLPSMPSASPSLVCPPSLSFPWVSQERCAFVMGIVAPGCNCLLLAYNRSRPGGSLEWLVHRRLEVVVSNLLSNTLTNNFGRVCRPWNSGQLCVTSVPTPL